LILNRDDAIYAANVFIDYFKSMNRIDEYLRMVKLSRVSEMSRSLPGMGPEDELFQDFSIHPRDMDFKIIEPDNDKFMRYLEITTSHAVESSVPGKSLRWMVKETNTNKIIGFIRIGSPTINSKPRNEFLGKPLDTKSKEVMKRFNDASIMGFIIVPTQPFGFNYLGGKLLAGLCCSHLLRETMNQKYNMNVCMFETTSLYGSTKSSSQYDGMKPFLRYKGLTDSNFAPLINDDNFRRLNDWFINKNNGVKLVHDGASSRKLKTQTKMVSIIKASLKSVDETMYKNFCKTFDDAKDLTERKRQYMSDYGFSNVKEYLNLETNVLTPKENYDRFNHEEIIDWWRSKASTRYETLKSENRLRTEIEVWSKNSDIDIIR
jgi:hypothetical protein